MITTNKIYSILRKNNIQHGDYGFQISKRYVSSAIEITYRSGRNWNLEKEIESFVHLGNLLTGLGFVVGFQVSKYNSKDIRFVLNDSNVDIYSEEFFRLSTAELLNNYRTQKEEENKEKAKKNEERERVRQEKIEIALALNDFSYSVLDEIDENHLICHTILNCQDEKKVYIQFSASRQEDWQDGKMRWNLALQPAYFSNGHFDGGSTSVNQCNTIEGGLLEYLIVWHIRVD